MNIYFSITYDDGAVQASEDFLCPERLPQPGDVYVVKKNFSTPAWRTYAPGHQLQILERTEEASHFRKNSLGNLRVKCPFFTSIWTNIETMIEQGNIELVKELIIA